MQNRPSAIALFIILASAAYGQDAWTVDHASSQLTYSVEIADQTAQGAFGSWVADIFFDPERPETGQVRVEIDMPTVSIADPRATAVANEAWLSVDDHPLAVFVADQFDLATNGTLVVVGTLTLKNIDAPMTLSGTLIVQGDTAQADLSGVIPRLTYDIGAGQDVVSTNVTVNATLTVHRSPEEN
jgi:polyisoprenoid-binding protein YceI